VCLWCQRHGNPFRNLFDLWRSSLRLLSGPKATQVTRWLQYRSRGLESVPQQHPSLSNQSLTPTLDRKWDHFHSIFSEQSRLEPKSQHISINLCRQRPFAIVRSDWLHSFPFHHCFRCFDALLIRILPTSILLSVSFTLPLFAIDVHIPCTISRL